MSRFTNPVPQFFLDDGSVASSGRMHFFENKNYSSLKNTYSKSDNTIPNTNPLILDGQGRLPSCFGEGLYSVKFYAANPDNPSIDGALQWTRDDVSLTELSGQFELWIPAETYELNDIVKDPTDGNYYQLWGSPTSTGEQPSASLTKWQLVYFLNGYNNNKDYEEGDVVVFDGYLYRANTDVSGVSPPSAQWDNLTFNDSVPGDFNVGGNLIVAGSTETDSFTNQCETYSAVRTTTKSIASSATLETDSDLTISNVPAGRYFVQLTMKVSGGGLTANGIKANIDGTSGTPIIESGVWEYIDGNAVSPVCYPSGIGYGAVFTGGSSAKVLSFSGMVRHLSGGNLFIEWAQFASNATATSVEYGTILATRIKSL